MPGSTYLRYYLTLGTLGKYVQEANLMHLQVPVTFRKRRARARDTQAQRVLYNLKFLNKNVDCSLPWFGWLRQVGHGDVRFH